MSSEVLYTENVRREDKLEIIRLIIVLNSYVRQLLENTMHCTEMVSLHTAMDLKSSQAAFFPLIYTFFTLVLGSIEKCYKL